MGNRAFSKLMMWAKEWLQENWHIIVVLILILFLLTRIQVPPR